MEVKRCFVGFARLKCTIIKGSCTVVEFRGSLVVYIVQKKYSRDSALTKIPSQSTLSSLSLVMTELVPDFPAVLESTVDTTRDFDS